MVGEQAEKVEGTVVMVVIPIVPLSIGVMAVMSIRPVIVVPTLMAVLVVRAAALVTMIFMLAVITVVPVVARLMVGPGMLLVMSIPASVAVTCIHNQWRTHQSQGEQGNSWQLVHRRSRFHDSFSISLNTIGLFRWPYLRTG